MKYEIYIKGCYDRDRNCASTAFVAVSDGEAVEKRSAKFDEIIPTKNGVPIPILPNKGQYQMELYALAWALSLLRTTGSDMVIYTNNQAVAGWLNKMDVPDDYKKIFSLCKKMAKGNRTVAEWMPKMKGDKWNKLVNDVVFELIKMKGSPITKIF